MFNSFSLKLCSNVVSIILQSHLGIVKTDFTLRFMFLVNVKSKHNYNLKVLKKNHIPLQYLSYINYGKCKHLLKQKVDS